MRTPRDYARCLLGMHTLSKYVAKPVMVERYRYGALIVRAAVGECDVCGRSAVRYTQATPRWQQHWKSNRLRRWFARVIGDYKEERDAKPSRHVRSGSRQDPRPTDRER